MKESKPSLMRLFSAILKERASSENNEKTISPLLLKYLSRKDLIEIITKIYDGELPEELSKVETENAQLLQLIGDDLYVISHMTQVWSRQPSASLKPETSTASNVQQENSPAGQSKKK